MNVGQIVPENKKKEALHYLEQIASGTIIESFETQRVT